MTATRRRHALFLQGMPSPFFRRIGQCLDERGWRVTRINLCFGDWLFWHDDFSIDYRGRFSRWPAFVELFMRREGVTDLLLLGEQRRYHREAVAAAKRLGVQVVVTDFGYLRPDWVIFEHDGISGGSRFPRDPEKIREIAAQCTVLDWEPRFVDSALQMAVGDLSFNFGNFFFRVLYPFYQRSDMRPPTLIYTLASARRLLGNRLRRTEVDEMVDEVVRADEPYYLFPMQLDFDYQIVAYSPFRGMDEVIPLVMDSFAKYAPPDAILVLKEHPWDPAIRDWRRFALNQARAMGLSERIRYVRGGDLNRLIQNARGVVLVNSTTGMRALQLRAPMIVLGQAVFDVPGLTFQGDLDDFWTEGCPPDSELADVFATALAGTVLLRGVFFKEPGLTEAVTEACHRLLTGTVGQVTARESTGGM
ncbi:hypothetical protein BJI67_10610 [Acidihalobacter aeolianus]|uniref:Capsular biosynthesis protein n=1 Tax=Acidihalobacter aeolianus TaxID=2792603 RepID=A0A1D8K901_9GAMM|nr:capsular biosynthesis protein [Acidihalobacter aeolianus]AOV17448.1 hypothetical protein BJI67_10610 [Acidihalobacter aeolianus]